MRNIYILLTKENIYVMLSGKPTKNWAFFIFKKKSDLVLESFIFN